MKIAEAVLAGSSEEVEACKEAYAREGCTAAVVVMSLLVWVPMGWIGGAF